MQTSVTESQTNNLVTLIFAPVSGRSSHDKYMLLSKGFLACFALSFGKNSYFFFGNPQCMPGDRLNLLTPKTNDRNN